MNFFIKIVSDVGNEGLTNNDTQRIDKINILNFTLIFLVNKYSILNFKVLLTKISFYLSCFGETTDGYSNYLLE
jgi:hypothetical protein